MMNAAVTFMLLVSVQMVSGQTGLQTGQLASVLQCANAQSGVCRLQCQAGELSVFPMSCSVYSAYLGVTYHRCVTSMPCCYWGAICQASCGAGQSPLSSQATCNIAGQVCCISNTLLPTGASPVITTRPPAVITAPPPTSGTGLSVAAVQGTCGSLRTRLNAGVRDLQLAQARIIGGVVAGRLDWPWMVRVVYSTGTAGFCAGVLVDDNTVITAAHCVAGVTASDMRVVLGDYNLSVNEPQEQVVTVSRYFVANGYRRGTRGRDYAVLKLAQLVTPFNNRKLPACLPDPTIPLLNPAQCYVAGWGVSEQGLGGPLRAMNVQLLDRATCQGQMSTFQNRIVTLPADIVCTNNPATSPSDGCMYDDGDMLVCRDVRGRWSLIGVMSEYTCGRGRGLPILFTDVRPYTQLTLQNLA